MTEEARENQTDCCNDKKNCTINIFCDGKKTHGMDDRKNNGHCIINIFCNDIKHENMNDSKKSDNHCIINIFCCDKKNDHKCNDENDW